ncbi:hypothetical protein [Aeromonas veronii]|uniref:hypothetical protein n=1 Tax=Aeromonas veronii TaxID=654 RepID=UPI003D1C859F
MNWNTVTYKLMHNQSAQNTATENCDFKTMATNKTCPICGVGQLHLHSEPIAVAHLGQQGTIESHYAVCDACGSEQAGADEARFNKLAMVEFKQQVQGLLTGDKVRGH